MQAVASVAAEKAARRDLAGASGMLAPLPPQIDDLQERGRYMTPEEQYAHAGELLLLERSSLSALLVSSRNSA